MSICIDKTHPPPSSFALRSLTTPTQRCWYCGGGQVPEDGGGWDKNRSINWVSNFLGIGKCNVVVEGHLKVALYVDKAVSSFGAELSRRAISKSKQSESRSVSKKERSRPISFISILIFNSILNIELVGIARCSIPNQLEGGLV